jgi:hypothetical protein
MKAWIRISEIKFYTMPLDIMDILVLRLARLCIVLFVTMSDTR